jgi:DNA-binding IclR family transcriptional regulator
VRDQLVLIDQVEGPEAVRLFSRIGSAYPYFHATAPGKVYLFHITGEKLRRVMDRMGLPKITKYTITSLAKLEGELDLARRRGYAFDHQEMRIGVSRVAAPVYDYSGKVVACLGVAGPSFRITPNSHEDIGRWTKELAGQLSRDLSEHTSAKW